MQTQVTYKCDTNNFVGSAVVGPQGKNFTCTVCGLRIHVNLEKLEFGAHGHTKNTLRHTLIKTQEVGVEK